MQATVRKAEWYTMGTLRKISIFKLEEAVRYINTSEDCDIVNKAKQIIRIRACDTKGDQVRLLRQMVADGEIDHKSEIFDIIES